MWHEYIANNQLYNIRIEDAHIKKDDENKLIFLNILYNLDIYYIFNTLAPSISMDPDDYFIPQDWKKRSGWSGFGWNSFSQG